MCASLLVWYQCEPRWRGRPCFLMQQLSGLSSEAGVNAKVNGKQPSQKKSPTPEKAQNMESKA